MKILDYKEIENLIFNEEGADKVNIRWLIGEKDNPPHFYLRMIEIGPGGHTPYHNHSKEHEVFVLEGEGKIIDQEGNEHTLREGTVVYVPAMEKHQFRNDGKKTFRFLCIIPK
jgi:quercetin dioxygenase-like cupin family protein